MTETLAQDEGWRAELRLGFTRREARTLLSRRCQRGPLYVQRPFYPEQDGTCHVYLLHPPGGVVGGDCLDIGIDLEANARCLVTTPAAGKFYRSPRRQAWQRQRLVVGSHACLEWFPQETIVFDGAQGGIHTEVVLEEGARFMGWEITCLGRPAVGERYQSGTYRQCFEIWRSGKPLWIERNWIDGGGEVQNAAWGMGGYPVTGTFVCVTGTSAAVEKLRASTCDPSGDELFCITLLGDVILCRFLGYHTESARRYFGRVWEVLRPLHTQRAACPPRIWRT